MKTINLKSIYTKISTFILLLAISTVPTNVMSQITIGSGIEPLKGSLLDLKERNDLSGDYTSTKGMLFPRVQLVSDSELFPMLVGNEANYESEKVGYKGMVVYNINTTTPFKEGLYVWDGEKWISFSAISDIKNWLKEGTSDVEAASTENQYVTGNIGIGNFSSAASIKAPLHIANSSNGDPIILQNMKTSSDPANELDASGASYHDLQISDNGVIRKKQLTETALNQSIMLDLNSNVAVASGGTQGATGGGGSFLTWKDNNGDIYEEVTLPEDGAFVFSFRLYGSATGGSTGGSTTYYLSAFKNGTTFPDNVFDIAEMVVVRGSLTVVTYSVNLTTSGKKGDSIRFKVSYNTVGANYTWTLRGNPGISAAKTSMIFWKI